MHEARRLVCEEDLLRHLLGRHTLKETAILMGFHYTTLRKYAHRPEFLEKLKALSQDIYLEVDAELRMLKESITSKLEEASFKALKTLEALIDEETTPPMVRYKAASDLLDRVPESSRTKRIEADHNYHLDPETLRFAVHTVDELEDK